MNKSDILLAEYNELRDELKQRITQRDSLGIQFITAVLAVLAAYEMGYSKSILLLPLLSIYFSIQIFSSYRVHTRLTEFIRENVEKQIADNLEIDAKHFLWESYCAFERDITCMNHTGGRKRFFQFVLLLSPIISAIICAKYTGWYIAYFIVMEVLSIIVCINDKRKIDYVGLNKLAFCDWQSKKPRTDEPQKAIFFDKDGTLHVDKVMTHKLKDLEILPGAVELVKKAHDAGYKVIIVTNQSAIAKGYYSKERMHLFIWALRRKLRWVDAVYYCPHATETGCCCKKPKTGMFKRAEKEFNINLSESIMVGDRMSDMKAGISAGVGRNIFVTTGIYADNDYRTEPGFDTLPHETVDSLEEIEL